MGLCVGKQWHLEGILGGDVLCEKKALLQSVCRQQLMLLGRLSAAHSRQWGGVWASSGTLRAFWV